MKNPLLSTYIERFGTETPVVDGRYWCGVWGPERHWKPATVGELAAACHAAYEGYVARSGASGWVEVEPGLFIEVNSLFAYANPSFPVEGAEPIPSEPGYWSFQYDITPHPKRRWMQIPPRAAR